MYNLAAASQKLSICLRCQFRLTSCKKLDPIHQARQSRLLKARHLSSGRRLQQEQLAFSLDDNTEYPASIPVSFDRYVGQDRIIFKPKADGHKWRRLRLGEQTVTLDMNVLGQPAQIRILPDRPKFRQDYPLVGSQHLEPIDSTSPEELLRSMTEDLGTLDPAHINKNIEEFRREITSNSILGSAPTLAQCREIARDLHDGFTTSQLEVYLKERIKNISEHETTNYDDLEERFRSTLCTRSPWFSGLSSFPEEAMLRLDHRVTVKKKDDFLIGFDPPDGRTKQTEKQRVVERILRQAWRIRCKEEKAMEGELDMRLQAEHLRLLLNHKTDLFKQLSEQYSAKIDISQSRHIVRITGDYAICSDLAKLIYFMIEKIESLDLELPTLTNVMRYKDSSTATARSALSDRSYVEHIEKLTNTLIKTNRHGNYATKLRVYYIGPDTTDFDDVQRLVYQLFNPSTTYKCQVQYDPQDSPMVPVQTPIEVGSAVPWTERRTPWTRWRDASRAFFSKDDHGSSSENTNVLSDNEARLSLARATGKFLSESRPRLRGSDHVEGDHIYWQPRQKHMVSALLGHIAYPVLSRLAQPNRIQGRTYKSRTDQETKFRDAFLKTIDSRRTVVTGLPESLRSFERLSGRTKVVHQDIRVRLQPSKVGSDGSVELRSLPEVDLCMKLEDSSKTANVEYVRFIQDQRESDLLLPREVADARFRAYTYFESKPQLDPRITDFIAASNFDVWGESRLKTPSVLALFVPRFALPVDVRGLINDRDGIEAEYVFTSLEYHSYMRTLYEGCRMHYDVVEAGKTGGRRTELWLEAPMEAPHSEYYIEKDFVVFFNSLCHLVSTMRQGTELSLP